MMCALTQVCEGPWMGKGEAEKAKWGMAGAGAEGDGRAEQLPQHNQGLSPIKSMASMSYVSKDQVDCRCGCQ